MTNTKFSRIMRQIVLVTGLILIALVAWRTIAPPALLEKASAAPVTVVNKATESVTVAVPETYRNGVFQGKRTLMAPPGFRVAVFAAGLGKARFMAVSVAGDIYLSVPPQGKILVLPDKNRDGMADRIVVFAEGLDGPHGLVFRGKELVVAENGRLTALLDTDNDLRADVKTVLSKDIAAGGGHATRSVVQGADGSLYVATGSSCNVCIEDDPRRATVIRFKAQGGTGEIFARGLRNTVGLAIHPVTGELWGGDNGRDMLGDDVPPEELNLIAADADYGWPYCYGNAIPDPDLGTPQRCANTRPPKVAIQAHSAPLGMTFGQGLAFPEEYRQALFVALHGSWNRSEPTGYKLLGVPFAAGKPQGTPFDIITGWLEDDEAWGRPVMPLVGPDGALYLSDDQAGAVYRISWKDAAPINEH
ncbi:MAG: PQQ-dependent sugar dehydrogenase [Gammaproteobacteria bacterium]